MQTILAKYLHQLLKKGEVKDNPIDTYSQNTFAQSGEDVIVNFIFQYILENSHPSYLDIGAHHPYWLSNTALFYKKGCKGVCIEPDPYLMENIRKERPRDICLNVGIGTGETKEADFYILSQRALNTFSKEEAERYVSLGTDKIEKVIKVPLLSINEVIEKNFDIKPNFVSIDVEGLDLEILKSFNFKNCRPEVFCIETISYSEDKTGLKSKEVIDFMLQQEYFVYADTYINSIFVDKQIWQNGKF